MASSLPRLTSLSTQTLTLLLERQRLQSLSGSTDSSISLPSSSLAQITRNLAQLRIGIHDIEDQQYQRNGGASANAKASRLLREQYGRMREMLGVDKDKVEELRPLSSPSGSPTKAEYAPGIELDPMITPYRDDPESARPYGDDTQPFDSADVLESQRLMMQDQDTHLDSLHSSLTRQHSLSQELSSELDIQTGLLTELDTDIDRTTSHLGRARRNLDKVGRGIGAHGSTMTIAALILVLLILIIVFKT